MAMMASCEKAEHLPEADWRFFDAQILEERPQAPNLEIQGWITTVKLVVNKGLWRASEQDRLHKRDIHEFFTVGPRDSEENDKDCICESKDDDSDSSCSSDSSSDEETDSPEEGEDRQRKGITQLVERKIADFFRRKPGAETRRLAPRQGQDQAQTEQEKDPKAHRTTRTYHYFRRRPPKPTDGPGTIGHGKQV
jgi:hypothetical protein